MQIATFKPPSLQRVRDLLEQAPRIRIAVIGDFFLDKYLAIDPALAEISVETGLEARQVVEVRCSPGAAGTVTNNLAALGVEQIEAVSVIGDDGEAYELLRGLAECGIGTGCVHQRRERFTPTYTKPMVRETAGERELERLDIKNRRPLAEETERTLLDDLRRLLAAGTDAVIVADQVQERNCGVVSDAVREGLATLAEHYPAVVFFADSRCRIGEFRSVVVKPNQHEAANSVGRMAAEQLTKAESAVVGAELADRNGRPAFITLGADGILVCRPDSAVHVPTLPVTGPIDIVGAGDSATAGIVTALCAGASPEEAAWIGNLCASVTIRKLGTTGTASPAEVLALLA